MGVKNAQIELGCIVVVVIRCDPDQKTRVLFENMRQHRAGHQTNAMGSSHSGLNDRESDSISALSRNHSCRNHLILNGMMMSPPNVNCERFVPAPNGVVPFNEVS